MLPLFVCTHAYLFNPPIHDKAYCPVHTTTVPGKQLVVPFFNMDGIVGNLLTDRTWEHLEGEGISILGRTLPSLVLRSSVQITNGQMC